LQRHEESRAIRRPIRPAQPAPKDGPRINLSEAFALDDTAYRTMAERARHFADYMFSPHSAVVATHAVYSALLAREP